jgi:molybdopterin converting factor small subunit
LKVTVELFGRASSQTGEREVALELSQGSTLRDAALALAERFPVLAWIPDASRPARNLEYVHWDDPIHDGDELSFIPPTSGG